MRTGPIQRERWLDLLRRSKSKSMAVIPWTRENAPDWFEWTGDFEICLRSAPIAPTFTVTARPSSIAKGCLLLVLLRRHSGRHRSAQKHPRPAQAARRDVPRNEGEQGARRAILGHETNAEAKHYDKSADLQKVVRGV